MNLLSSGSAVSGFPCSKPPLNPIVQASSIKWGLFYYPINKTNCKAAKKFNFLPPKQEKTSGHNTIKQELIDML
jgi:hypothetical protein